MSTQSAAMAACSGRWMSVRTGMPRLRTSPRKRRPSFKTRPPERPYAAAVGLIERRFEYKGSDVFPNLLCDPEHMLLAFDNARPDDGRKWQGIRKNDLSRALSCPYCERGHWAWENSTGGFNFAAPRCFQLVMAQGGSQE